MTTEPTPDLCCKHGERIDRLVELMEEVHAARVGKPATGGLINAGPVVLDGVDCVGPSQEEVAGAVVSALKRQGRLRP